MKRESEWIPRYGFNCMKRLIDALYHIIRSFASTRTCISAPIYSLLPNRTFATGIPIHIYSHPRSEMYTLYTPYTCRVHHTA